MLEFACDYNRGAHEKILKRLMEENQTGFPGYGTDAVCERAKERIRKACGYPDASVFFTMGGTQTNQLVIDSMLEKYEGVIAADTGHIHVHEAGAVEYSGHKVLSLSGTSGKLSPESLAEYMVNFYADENREHMVFPGMVYISYPTEYGTIYSKKELEEIYKLCRQYEIPLYVDGARLGYGMMCEEADVTMEALASLCDVFYIGGTKVGALFGEALVFPKGKPPRQFVTRMKQHGALLAKGWLLGLQFDVLFENDLYFEISRHAILQAEKLKEMFRRKNWRFFIETPTNQIFVILENRILAQIKGKVSYSFWEKYDENASVVRFATSFATTDEELDALWDVINEVTFRGK